MRAILLLAAGLMLAACERTPAQDTAEACFAAEDAEARIAACTRVAEDSALSPQLRSQALSARAGAYAEAGDVPAGLRDYMAALELDETNAAALLGRGEILLNSGQLDAAEPLLRRAVEIDNSARANELLGRILLRGGRYTDAIGYFNAALDGEPRAAGALAARARAKQRVGDLDGAANDYNAAIRLDGNLAEARAGRCWLDLNEERELDRARNDAEAAVAADPRNVEAQLCRGVLQLRGGEWAGARASFDAVLESEAGNPIALFGRGVARRRSGDNDGRADMNLARDFDRHIGQQFDDMGVATF